MNIIEFIHLLPGLNSRHKKVRTISSVLYIILFSSWIVSIFFTAYVNYLSKTVIDVIRLVESRRYPAIHYEELERPRLKPSRTNLIEKPVKDAAYFVMKYDMPLQSREIKELNIFQPKYLNLAPISYVYARKEIAPKLGVHNPVFLTPRIPAKYRYLKLEKVKISRVTKKNFLNNQKFAVRLPYLKLTEKAVKETGLQPVEVKPYRYDIGQTGTLKFVAVAKNGFKKLVWEDMESGIKPISGEMVYPSGKKYGRIGDRHLKAPLKYGQVSPTEIKKENLSKEIPYAYVSYREGKALEYITRKNVGVSEKAPKVLNANMPVTEENRLSYTPPGIQVIPKKAGIISRTNKKPEVKTYSKPQLSEEESLAKEAQRSATLQKMPEGEKELYPIMNGPIMNKYLKRKSIEVSEIKEIPERKVGQIAGVGKVVSPELRSPNENVRLMEKPKVIFKSEIKRSEIKTEKKALLLQPKFEVIGD